LGKIGLLEQEAESQGVV